MAYRSDIGLAITADGLAEFINGDSMVSSIIMKRLSLATHYESKACNHFYFWEDDIWDPSSDKFEQQLNTLASNLFYYVKIGEEICDIEEVGCWVPNDFKFGIERAITFQNIEG